MTQIVKLGGSVITHDDDGPSIDHDTLQRLAREVTEPPEPIVLVHGAGVLGHPLAHENALHKGLQDDADRSAMATVHANVRRLNLALLEALEDEQAPAVTLSPLGMLSTNDAEPGGWNLVPVHRVIEQDLIPVLHGDLVLDTTRGISVLSGDTIAAELARFLDATRLVFALDQDGVFSHPPELEDATLLTRPSPQGLAEARERATGGDEDVTGAMAGKLERAVDAVRSGTEVCLVNGRQPDRVRRALEGDVKGTVLDPGGQAP